MTESETTTLAALQIDRELFAQAPMRPFARRYLAASLQQLGDLRRAQQRYEDADAAYQESLQLRLALARELLDVTPAQTATPSSDEQADRASRATQPAFVCRHCGHAMTIVHSWIR